MFYGSVGRVGLRSSIAPFSPASLFAAGETGAWYDPSDITTLYQDASGRTPVTAVAQPVGLILDKSKGPIPGPELVTNGNFDSGTTTGWTSVNGSTLSVVNGFLRVTNGATNFGAAQQIITTVVGKTYKLTFTVGTQTGTSSAWIGSTLGGIEYQDFDFITSGNYTLIFTATTTTAYLRFQNRQTTIGNISDFDNISVCELPGNHAKQSTGMSRPILKQDAGGLYYLEFDGTDDFIEAPAFTMPGPYSVWAGIRSDSTGLSLIVNSDTAGLPGEMPQYLRVNSSAIESIAFTNSNAITDVGPSITTTSNFVVAANCSASSLDVTVNGESNGSTSVVGTLASVSKPFTVGRYTNGGFNFDGRIYQIILRGKASTADEMNLTENWVNGKTGAY